MIEYQAEHLRQGRSRGLQARLAGRSIPQGARARFATAAEIAEFVFAVSSPSLAPLTGACLSIDFGTTAGR